MPAGQWAMLTRYLAMISDGIISEAGAALLPAQDIEDLRITQQAADAFVQMIAVAWTTEDMRSAEFPISDYSQVH